MWREAGRAPVLRRSYSKVKAALGGSFYFSVVAQALPKSKFWATTKTQVVEYY
jgi:hypothetical protein